MAYSAWAMSKHLGEEEEEEEEEKAPALKSGRLETTPFRDTFSATPPRDRLVLFVRSHQSTATVSERHSLRPWSCFVTVYYDLVVVLCIFIYVSRIMYPNVSKISAPEN